MDINIDLTFSGNKGGISNYILSIANELSVYNDINLKGCYNYTRTKHDSDYLWFKGNKHKSFVPLSLAYGKRKIPFTYEAIMRSKADCNVFLTYMLPHINFKAPVYSTIHDLIPLKVEVESNVIRDDYVIQVKRCLRKSTRILTVSEYSKNDICETFDVDPSKISVVTNGINFNIFSSVSSLMKTRVAEKYNLPRNFILYLGGYRKHKNLERLLVAYSHLSAEIRKIVKLVFSCRHENLVNLASELNVLDDVIFTGFVDEVDKPALYSLATLVYYASLYEGFGVPIIEAQAAGVPVITSNCSSMPEASGGFAEFVDPYDIDNIEFSINKLLDNPDLRHSLVSGGLRNAQKYSWDNSALQLHSILFKDFGND